MTNPFKTGDLVKSYHFKPLEGRDDMYLVGRVTSTNSHEVTFDIIADVDGDDYNYDMAGESASAPAPGMMMFLEWDGRITKI